MKNTIVCTLAILFVIHLAQQGYAQLFSSTERAVYHDLLRLKTHSDHVLVFAATADPTNLPLHIYLLNFRSTILLLANDVQEDYKQQQETAQQYIRLLKPFVKKNDYTAQWVEAMLHLQWAVIKLKYDDNFSAFWGFRKGYQLLQLLEERFPKQTPHKVWLGVMQVMLEQVPERYHWLLQLLGLQGDAAKGWVHIAAAKAHPEWGAEAIRYEAFLQLFIMQQEKAAYQTFSRLYTADTTDMLSLFALCQLSLKLGKANAVLPLLSDANIAEGYGNLAIFDYFHGILRLQKGEYQRATLLFHRFLNRFNGDNYRKDTYYRLFLAHWLHNNPDSAKQYFENIKTQGAERISADRYAQQFAQNEQYPHKKLMQARLYTDGGYYQQALNVLEEVQLPTLSPAEMVEFFYRKARIFHRRDQWEEAIRHYETTLKKAPIQTENYFAPNAALQLGIIFKEYQQDTVQARLYFKKVLEYPANYPYRNSLRHQAKQHLKRM